jgi:hypothetical protein
LNALLTFMRKLLVDIVSSTAVSMANMHFRMNAMKFVLMVRMLIQLLFYAFKLARMTIIRKIKFVIKHAQMDTQTILLKNVLMFVRLIIMLNCLRENVFKIVSHNLNIS